MKPEPIASNQPLLRTGHLTSIRNLSRVSRRRASAFDLRRTVLVVILKPVRLRWIQRRG